MTTTDPIEWGPIVPSKRTDGGAFTPAYSRAEITRLDIAPVADFAHWCKAAVAQATTTRRALDPEGTGRCRFCGEVLPT